MRQRLLRASSTGHAHLCRTFSAGHDHGHRSTAHEPVRATQGGTKQQPRVHRTLGAAAGSCTGRLMGEGGG